MQKLLTDKGRELTLKYFIDKDAQSVFCDLVEFHTTSTLGESRITDLLQYITHTKIGERSTWNGTTHAFILHFQQQMSTYNQYNPDGKLSGPMMMMH